MNKNQARCQLIAFALWRVGHYFSCIGAEQHSAVCRPVVRQAPYRYAPGQPPLSGVQVSVSCRGENRAKGSVLGLIRDWTNHITMGPIFYTLRLILLRYSWYDAARL